MKRRGFLRRVLGTTAIAAIAPDILKQIEEYEYVVEGKPRPSKIQGHHAHMMIVDDHFPEGGFWAISDQKIIAWSTAQGVTLNMIQPVLDVTSLDTIGGYREFISGFSASMEATFQIDNLHIVDHAKFREHFEEEGSAMDIVSTIPDGVNGPVHTFSGEGIVTEFGIIDVVDFEEEEIIGSATFKITGELIRNDD